MCGTWSGTTTITASAAGCNGPATTTHVVTVNPSTGPTIFTAGATTICQDAPDGTYTATAANSTLITYTVMPVTAGSINTITGLMNWSPVFSGIATITATSSGLCGTTSADLGVTVNPAPNVTTASTTTICSGDLTNIALSSDVPGATFTWTIGAISGSVSGASASGGSTIAQTLTNSGTTTGTVTYIVTPTANSCPGAPTNIVVTVKALPAFVSTTGNRMLCEFGVTTFNVTATGSDLSYQWYVNQGSGFVALGDTAVYFGANQKTLSLYGVTRRMSGYIYHAVVSGCSPSVTSTNDTLRVNTIPEIIHQPKDSTICATKNATFKVSATGTALTFQWQVKIGGASFINVSGPNFTGANDSILIVTNAPGSFNNYVFRVIVGGTCGVGVYSNFVVLRVNVAPVVVKHPDNKPVCDLGGPVYFTAYGSGMIDSLRWQVSTDVGATWSDIHDNAIYSGTTTQQLSIVDVPLAYNNNRYRLALKAICETSYTNGAILTVNSLPVISFASDPINACGGVAQFITPVITGGSGTWTQHIWSGEVGPLNNYFIQSPTFKTMIAATYNLNYKVKDSNGCYGEKAVAVVVDAPSPSI